MTTILLTAFLALTGPQQPQTRSAESQGLRIDRCLVSVIDKVDVPAQAPGLIVSLEAIEGLEVEKGARLGQIDDAEAAATVEIRTAELAKAEEKVKNDVNIRYANAATDSAKADYDAAVAANKKVPGAVLATEMRARQLAWKKTVLEIEQAEYEAGLAKRDVEAYGAQLRAAQLDVQRRQFIAPVNGMVVEVVKHVGEWANAGELVFRVVGLDRLRVEGFVDAAKYTPLDVAGRPVKVEVALNGDRKEQFAGKIVFVDPYIQQPGGMYKVWAEVTNLQEKGHWLLRPGHQVQMEIELAPIETIAEK